MTPRFIGLLSQCGVRHVQSVSPRKSEVYIHDTMVIWLVLFRDMTRYFSKGGGFDMLKMLVEEYNRM